MPQHRKAVFRNDTKVRCTEWHKECSLGTLLFLSKYFYSISYEALCHCEASTGVPAGYCVPVGKSNKQAKDKQLSLATIVWSKVKFMTRDVAIAGNGHRIIKPTQDYFALAWRRETNKCCVMKLFAHFFNCTTFTHHKTIFNQCIIFSPKVFSNSFSSF